MFVESANTEKKSKKEEIAEQNFKSSVMNSHREIKYLTHERRKVAK